MTGRSDFPGVAAITGAASGIGRATAIAFAKEGCLNVALLDINEQGLAETERLVRAAIIDKGNTPNTKTFILNVVLPENVATTYAAIKARFDRIDYAVQCAGIITFDSPSADCSLETFDRENAINYKGLWLCTREVIRIMRKQNLDCEAYPEAAIPPYRAQRGSIVNISSGMALRHQRGCPIYSASKAAVLAVSRGDGVDYAVDRIRVNSVLPGIVDSPMIAADSQKLEFLQERASSLVPLRRFGQPEEVADVCVFLAGNKASYITAAAWQVDGGRCGT